METNNKRTLCQRLWAENKYLVLSHSSNIYNEIRQYLKNEEVEVSLVQEMIDRACQIPEHRGQVCNAFQHIWGYFKKKATENERKDYMLLLDRYRFGQASKEDLIAKTRDLLERYPNTYLQNSTLLKGNSHETLA
ncbi:PF08349 family protein [Streptococcus mitis SK579]|nr:PF08349 family protein [Streptococcus mitis SK579]